MHKFNLTGQKYEINEDEKNNQGYEVCHRLSERQWVKGNSLLVWHKHLYEMREQVINDQNDTEWTDRQTDRQTNKERYVQEKN